MTVQESASALHNLLFKSHINNLTWLHIYLTFWNRCWNFFFNLNRHQGKKYIWLTPGKMLHSVNSSHFHTASNMAGKSLVLDNPYCISVARKAASLYEVPAEHSCPLQHHLVTADFLEQVRGTMETHQVQSRKDSPILKHSGGVSMELKDLYFSVNS